MRKSLVLGGGGFIGGHLAKALKQRGDYVTVVDMNFHRYINESEYRNEFIFADLRSNKSVENILCKNYDEVYQLASDVGGAGYISTGFNSADIMSNSAMINLNVVKSAIKNKIGKIFFSSSSCVYPNPDGEYGHEKLFSEKLYLSYQNNYNLNVLIGRFQNVYGIYDTIGGIREKCVVALCRKVTLAKEGDEIEVWGDGSQVRYFINVRECIETVLELMKEDRKEPVNIGTYRAVSINDMAKIIINASGKELRIKNIYGKEFVEKYGFECPVGVRLKEYENPYNTVGIPLLSGIKEVYEWVKKEVNGN